MTQNIIIAINHHDGGNPFFNQFFTHFLITCFGHFDSPFFEKGSFFCISTIQINLILHFIDKSIQTASRTIRNLERQRFVISYRDAQSKICSITDRGETFLLKHLEEKEEDSKINEG